MANLNTRSFTQLVQAQAAAIQARATALVDFTIGSILRAVVEANAAIGLWLQGLILQVLTLARASTSVGTDLDSWVADFGLSRLGSVASAGTVTFSRLTATGTALVPVGAVVQTADGTQSFTVVIDTANSAYSATLGGYTMAATVASVNVPVKANTPSLASNVLAGTITVMTTTIVGVDAVTNAATMTGGADAESDVQLRTRFLAYIVALSKATRAAVGYAVSSLQLGLSYTITENANYDGSPNPGYFYVVVDDGTGTPSSTLLTQVYGAVDAVRPVGTTFAVFAPVVVPINVSMTLTILTGYDANTVKGIVGTAITAYIRACGLGVPINYTKLAQVAYDASPGVTNVSSLLLNAGTADVAISAKQISSVGTITIS
ncbi:baseplate J/gp47 family protein [uncultured Alsobacter sp.]|uniref:baseplate J/gp47 family protein n=1 Tax=uncultured Alsobacter sp. TaxID=1748258 RepID=UPI0025EB5892|nr:baseplate J/gp47 family protein [uncultured Alsobacter sp.]